MLTPFREPSSLDDAKQQLKRLDKAFKKAQEEYKDAEQSQYPLGMKVQKDRMEELSTAKDHFKKWAKEHTKMSHKFSTHLLASPTKADVEWGLRGDEESLKKAEEALARMKAGEKLPHYTIDGAERNIQGLKEAIKNKKSLLRTLN